MRRRAQSRTGVARTQPQPRGQCTRVSNVNQATFAFCVEVLLCLIVGAACGGALYARGFGVETVGMLLVWEYGLYRVTAPLLSDCQRATKLRVGSVQARADGFLIGQLCLPIVFASNLLAWHVDKLHFWQAVCMSFHATVIAKPVRKDHTKVATASVVACCMCAAYFGAGGAFVRFLLSGLLFDLLFRVATTSMAAVSSPGEALIICSGVSIYVVDAVCVLAAPLVSDAQRGWSLGQPHTSVRSDVEHVVQMLLVWAFAMAVALFPLMEWQQSTSVRAGSAAATPAAPAMPLADVARLARRRARSNSSEQGAVVPTVCAVPPATLSRAGICWFVAVTAAVLVAMGTTCWLLLHRDPASWLLDYLAADTTRWQFVLFWGAVLAVVVVVHPTSSKTGLRNIIVRKFFHGVALLLFVPAMMLQFDLLYLSFGIATAVLLLVEYIRLFRVPPLGKALHGFMSAYLDHRDDGPLILTHIYLLLGCAIPVWMCGSGPTARPLHRGQTTWGVGGLAPYAGIISLGVGDAAAACVGTVYGRHRWWGTHKTLEGTTAAVASMLASTAGFHIIQAVVCPNCASIWPSTSVGVVSLTVSTLLVCLMETFTTQIDNLVIPLYFYALVQLTTLFDGEAASGSLSMAY